ncbi:dTDP-4-dehydrorhamnose 3,5-epimerase [uncultured Devosia sp.]|uniref:dTDP-4-dehydrorhamnose 3,5-epimerase n=1 Tax=uncultured Devosia sp. TaxID=211434 RepID=UPI0035C99988
MIASPLALPDVILFEPQAFKDDRGFFFESFNQQLFDKAVGRPVTFVQDNHSASCKDVLRGLHYQTAPSAQGKLVRVVRGAAFDVAIDIRDGSLTFGKWVGELLTGENRRQLWIPEGFAHGFLALEDHTEFLYKVTNFYDRNCDRSVRWDDPTIGIDWPLTGVPLLSAKDAAAPFLQENKQ